MQPFDFISIRNINQLVFSLVKKLFKKENTIAVIDELIMTPQRSGFVILIPE
jgi:hypothetical protein